MPLLSPFSFEKEDTWRRRFSHEEEKGLIREYAGLRLLLKDPMTSMEVKVLQPICHNCLRPWPEPDDPPLSFGVRIHPPRELSYLYPPKAKPRRTYLGRVRIDAA